MDEIAKQLPGYGPLAGTLFVCWMFAKYVTETRNAMFEDRRVQLATFEKLSERVHENTNAVNRLADAVDDFNENRPRGTTT